MGISQELAEEAPTTTTTTEAVVVTTVIVQAITKESTEITAVKILGPATDIQKTAEILVYKCIGYTCTREHLWWYSERKRNLDTSKTKEKIYG